MPGSLNLKDGAGVVHRNEPPPPSSFSMAACGAYWDVSTDENVTCLECIALEGAPKFGILPWDVSKPVVT